MRAGSTIEDVATEVLRQAQASRDFVAHTKFLSYSTAEKQAAGSLRLESKGSSATGGEFEMTDHARAQLATRLGIPLAYFDRMRNEQPELLDENVNVWLRDPKSGDSLVRTLDGKVRALLSNRYRRLDNWEVLKSVLPFLQQLPGAYFESVHLSDKKLYIKVTSDRLEADLGLGDIVRVGVVISNSEVGAGALSVIPLLYRLVCKNGASFPKEGTSRSHIGRLLESDDDIAPNVLANETIEADNLALFLKMRDVVAHVMSETTLQLLASKMKATKGVAIVGDPVQVVQVLSNRFSLTQEEQSGVLRSLIAGGDLSAFGLVNAVTAHSQHVCDYDRATEMESVGGRLLGLDKVQWGPIVTAGQ